jgi:hypothetical protein
MERMAMIDCLKQKKLRIDLFLWVSLAGCSCWFAFFVFLFLFFVFDQVLFVCLVCLFFCFFMRRCLLCSALLCFAFCLLCLFALFVFYDPTNRATLFVESIGLPGLYTYFASIIDRKLHAVVLIVTIQYRMHIYVIPQK